MCHPEVDGKIPIDVRRARFSPSEIWHWLRWGSVNMDCSDNILILSVPNHPPTLCPNRRKNPDGITSHCHPDPFQKSFRAKSDQYI